MRGVPGCERGVERVSSGHSPECHCLQKLGDLGELLNVFGFQFARLQTVCSTERVECDRRSTWRDVRTWSMVTTLARITFSMHLN